MGTHPSGPSKLESNDSLLSSWLKNNSSAVGKVPALYPIDDLPFLFKVLSVETALSIQVNILFHL
jgi:mannose-6-phosphate isomerase